MAGPSDTSEAIADSAEPTRTRSFPHPITILAGVIVLVWIAAWFIPAGQYDIGADGRPIPSSYHEIDAPLDAGERVQDLLLSPVNGMYGITDPETGQVGPFNSGWMFGGVQVFLFILAIGGFMTVVFATGSLNLGIARLAHRYATRGNVLIISLSILFGILGSTMSWSDETLGMYPLLIPLFLALGFDRMVAVSVVWLAPSAGIIGSTVNPFKIGIGSDAADVGIGDGIVLRLLLLVTLMAATIIYTLRYARRVKADPEASIVGFTDEDLAIAEDGASDDLAPMTGRDRAVVALVAFTFVLLVFSIIPWGSILNNTIVDPVTHETITEAFPWELGWWLPELSVLFVVMAVVVGAVAKLGEATTARSFIQGVMDFTGAAILVAVARAVSVILNNTQTTDTVLNSMEGLVDGTNNVGLVFVLSLVTLPITFLVGAASAGNALVMPLLAPLGDFAGVDRSLIVTIFNAIGAWFGNILPTNALLMAGLGIAKVGFNKYLKFVLPLMGIWLVIQLALFIAAAAL